MSTPAEEAYLNQQAIEMFERLEEAELLEHEAQKRQTSAEPVQHWWSMSSSFMLCTFMYGCSSFLMAGMYYFVNSQMRR